MALEGLVQEVGLKVVGFLKLDLKKLRGELKTTFKCIKGWYIKRKVMRSQGLSTGLVCSMQKR